MGVEGTDMSEGDMEGKRGMEGERGGGETSMEEERGVGREKERSGGRARCEERNWGEREKRRMYIKYKYNYKQHCTYHK